MILVYKTNKGRTFEVDSEEVRLVGRGGVGTNMKYHGVKLRKDEYVVSVKPKEKEYYVLYYSRHNKPKDVLQRNDKL